MAESSVIFTFQIGHDLPAGKRAIGDKTEKSMKMAID